jgi:selenocysteine lyase/cysteine desulfurase
MGGAPLYAPDDAIGAMASIPISLAGVTPFALQTQLLREGWEVPIVDFPESPLVRLSAHLYNHAGEADLLARKLHDLGVRLACS